MNFVKRKKTKEKPKTVNSIEAAKKILAEERQKEESSKKSFGFKRSHLRKSRDSKPEELIAEPPQKRQKIEELASKPTKTSKLDSVLENMRSSGIVPPSAPLNSSNLSMKELEQRSVCVTNLSDRVDENALRGKFSKFGNIIKLECYLDQGYALVYFSSEESVHAAESMNNKPFCGSTISVYKPSLSESVEQKPTFAEPPSVPSFVPSYSSSSSTSTPSTTSTHNEPSGGKNFGKVFTPEDTPSSFEELNSGGRKLTTYDDL